MKHFVGCDIVYLPVFAQSVQEGGGESFLEKLFVPSERNMAQSLESLAGYFAIKESVIKAIGTKVSWLDIVVYKQDSGKPAVRLPLTYTFYQAEVSVAHHGDYVIAMALLSKETE